MVRILVETSLPAHTVGRVEAGLASLAGVSARLERAEGGPGCQSPAAGGDAGWTPCWLSLEGEGVDREALRAAAQRLKALVVEACREGCLEVYALPASAQIGDGYYRLRDVADAPDRLP